MSRADQVKAYRAGAAEAEKKALAEVRAEGVTLYTSSRSETGYRCVSKTRLERLGTFAYEVKTIVDGELLHLGGRAVSNVSSHLQL